MARHTIPDIIDRTETRPAARRPLCVSLVLSLRPTQWTKNLIVFAALMFAGRLFDPGSDLRALAAFAIFCALSGVVYLINDVADREADRRHPVKMHRPIASGDLPVPVALSAAAVIGGGAISSAFVLRPLFGVLATSYLALLGLYSGPLKHIVIIDVLTDNKNRTVGELRHLLTKHSGNLAETNAVAWMFTKRGYIVVPKNKADEETLMATVIDAGGENLRDDQDNWEILSSPETFPQVL